MIYFDLQATAFYKIRFGDSIFKAFFKVNSSLLEYRLRFATLGKPPQFFLLDVITLITIILV